MSPDLHPRARLSIGFQGLQGVWFYEGSRYFVDVSSDSYLLISLSGEEGLEIQTQKVDWNLWDGNLEKNRMLV